MRTKILTLACVGALTLTACENMTRDEQLIFGGLAGATIGALTADALHADTNWIIIGALAGAAIGTLVARNEATDECAYSRGDGTYRIARCP